VRIITVSGAHRSVGKTTFARCLKAKLPGKAEIIKIGHGPAKEKPERLFHSLEDALLYLDRVQAAGSVDYLIIESNRIAGHLEPDLAVFLESGGRPDAANAPVDARVGEDTVSITRAGAEPVSVVRARKSAHIRVVWAGSHDSERGSGGTVARPAERQLRKAEEQLTKLEEQLSKLGALDSDDRKAVAAALAMFLESSRR
jgi:hypothetical protein